MIQNADKENCYFDVIPYPEKKKPLHVKKILHILILVSLM